MVNLISPKQKAFLAQTYVSRFLTVAFLLLAGLGSATLALLAPSYFIIHAEADQAEEYVQTATQIAAERAKGQSQETLQRFHEAVGLLTKAGRPASYAHILSITTEERPAGVFIAEVHVAYEDDGSALVTLIGTARTRAELIAYSNMLKKTPELTAVVVPVSALVADVNSEFTITLKWVRPKQT